MPHSSRHQRHSTTAVHQAGPDEPWKKGATAHPRCLYCGKNASTGTKHQQTAATQPTAGQQRFGEAKACAAWLWHWLCCTAPGGNEPPGMVTAAHCLDTGANQLTGTHHHTPLQQSNPPQLCPNLQVPLDPAGTATVKPITSAAAASAATTAREPRTMKVTCRLFRQSLLYTPKMDTPFHEIRGGTSKPLNPRTSTSSEVSVCRQLL
jgi:hypothetical protein